MIAYVFQKYPGNFVFQITVYSNLPVKFAIFLKGSLILTVSVIFSVYKQNFKN